MAGTITHSWNGTILTITSDSGTSSMDLKGATGDTGVRGPQGAPGIVLFNELTPEQKEEIISEVVTDIDGTAAELEAYKTATDERLAALEEGGGSEAVAADLEEYKTTTDERLAALEEALANGGPAAPVYDESVVIE